MQEPHRDDDVVDDLETIIDLRPSVPEPSGETDGPGEPASMHRIDAMLELSELAADDRESPGWSRFH